MAITFRGQASRLNKETKGRNQVGFQDKSAAATVKVLEAKMYL